MGLGLRGQTSELRALLDEKHRYTDIACQFEIYRRKGEDAVPTGELSPIYGGKWDRHVGDYIDDADSDAVLRLPASAKQFELAVSDTARIESNGGRGSGKSDGGIQRALRYVCERPMEKGQVVSPTADLSLIVWEKLLQRIPLSWLLPGTQGVKMERKTLVFANGGQLRFRSADNPNSLRSWGGSYCFADEEQDFKKLALDIIIPSLREGSSPKFWTCGTPKPGEYQIRHEKLLEDSEATVLRFDSYTNCFVSHEAFKLSKRHMDERTYRQEILAEWVFDEDLKLVANGFSREKHSVEFPLKNAVDITAKITHAICGVARAFIGGTDYNWDYPNYCVLYKVYRQTDDRGVPIKGIPNKWVAVNVVRSKGHAGHLGHAIKEAGYSALDRLHRKDVLILDDASGQYNKGPKSSSRLMRKAGFEVKHPNRNPPVHDRVNAFNAKLNPVEGESSWGIVLPECEELAESLETLEWANGGKGIDKIAGKDHVFDGCSYPVIFFEPAARFQIPQLRGVIAR